MNQRIRIKSVDEILAQHEADLEAFRHYGAHVLAALSVLMVIGIVAFLAYGLTVAA